MNFILKTSRLYLREISLDDIQDLYEMDSDPEVHLYIDNNPVKKIEELVPIIENLQNQYLQNGIARWAVVDQISNEMIGWCGLKFYKDSINSHRNFYELGYRFKQKHWKKGYATESAKAVLQFGFENLKIQSIYAITNAENLASQHVLKKLGFHFHNSFDYEGYENYWYALFDEDWIMNNY